MGIMEKKMETMDALRLCCMEPPKGLLNESGRKHSTDSIGHCSRRSRTYRVFESVSTWAILT